MDGTNEAEEENEVTLKLSDISNETKWYNFLDNIK